MKTLRIFEGFFSIEGSAESNIEEVYTIMCMIKKILKYVLFLTVTILILGVLGNEENQKIIPGKKINTNTQVTTLTPESAAKPLASTRSFYMGFSSWPPDATVEAVNQMYVNIDAHADLIFHHFDNGVPWPEAHEGKPFSKHLEGDWNWKKAKTPVGKKVYLGITPLNFDRDGMVGYWGESGSDMPLPDNWKNLRLNDQKVKTAYLNYARRAVEYFNPDYLSIGSEVNILAAKDRAKWNDYLELNAYVYNELKKKYPSLPIFISFQYSWLRGDEKETEQKREEQVADAKKALQSSDVIALTLYKYGTLHNPVVGDYFGLAQSLASKPIGLAELGGMSRSAKIAETSLPATEDDQNEFIKIILRMSEEKKFIFVNNYFSMDFDSLLEKFLPGNASIASAWAHMGLFDGNGRAKKALTTWDEYFRLPKK